MLSFWPPLRTILTLITAWFLGGRLIIAIIYLQNKISNPDILRVDLVIAAFVGFLILADLDPKYRATRAQAIRLIILGLIVAGTGAFITLMVYSFAAGVLGEY